MSNDGKPTTSNQQPSSKPHPNAGEWVWCNTCHAPSQRNHEGKLTCCKYPKEGIRI